MIKFALQYKILLIKKKTIPEVISSEKNNEKVFWNFLLQQFDALFSFFASTMVSIMIL